MWVAKAAAVKESQDLIHVAKIKITPEDVVNKKNQTSSNSGDTVAINGVSLNISEEAQQKLDEQNNMLEFLQMQLESTREQVKAGEEGWADYGKCLVIARRIANGDNVPMQDIDFLREKNPELFLKAMSMRMPNKDPEDCESVLEDEEDKEEGPDGAKVVAGNTIVESSSSESSTAAGGTETVAE